MLKEFKEFVMRGNVIDMAVGIIIGISFGAIVSSLVNDIIMPPIGMLLGKINFADMYINLTGQSYANLAAAKAAGAATINFGVFINTVINFILVALVLFLVVKGMNAIRKPAPPAATPETKDCPYCLTKVAKKATRCPACTSEL